MPFHAAIVTLLAIAFYFIFATRVVRPHIGAALAAGRVPEPLIRFSKKLG